MALKDAFVNILLFLRPLPPLPVSEQSHWSLMISRVFWNQQKHSESTLRIAVIVPPYYIFSDSFKNIWECKVVPIYDFFPQRNLYSKPPTYTSSRLLVCGFCFSWSTMVGKYWISPTMDIIYFWLLTTDVRAQWSRITRSKWSSFWCNIRRSIIV